MTHVDNLAAALGVSGRTLRRGIGLGLVRGSRMTQRWTRVAPDEEDYLIASWAMLDAIRRALRNERRVRFALLHGDAARNRPLPRPDCPVRILLTFFAEDPGGRARLHRKLASATGREIRLTVMDEVEDQPRLLLDAIRHGRVLVDRRGTDWRWLKRQDWRLRRAEQSAPAQ
ncbi:MAG: hypothetical protein QOD76_1754 [Solirubrobacteraceae bacterium]|nr:hypothetical protein [Solirubrobacteraceae bacterium]